MDYSPPGSSIHGILQARTLEWVSFPSPGDLLNPGLLHLRQILYYLSHQRSPLIHKLSLFSLVKIFLKSNTSLFGEIA